MLDKDYLIKGDMYQYNLGWLIKELLSFKQDLATAIDLKTIKYADPIQWDITTQYPANTVVVDPKSGTAYMSKVPVPAGVELTNTNYWVVVFNYQDIYNRIMDGVAFNDRDQDYATKDLLVNDLVWYAGDLYRVTRAIPTGSKYIPGTNLIKTSIESLLARYYGRDRTAQVSNDTVNVSGDYTLVAGDIAETSTNRTVKVTKDREIDVDGSDSAHIDGASTVNVGGLRTEVYAGDKTEKVTGTTTEGFTGTHTENHVGKKIVNATDIVLNPTEPLTYKTPTNLSKFFDSIPFKDPLNHVYNVLAANEFTDKLISNTVSPLEYGAIGDGITDDSDALVEAAKHGVVDGGDKTYKVDKVITLNNSIINTVLHLDPLAQITVNGKYVIRCTFFSNKDSLPHDRGRYALAISNNDNCYICNNIFYDMMNAIHVEHSACVRVVNNIFKNIIQTASDIGGNGYGIVTTDAHYMEISGNVFIDVARHCIYLSVEGNDAGSENIQIVNNIFHYDAVTTRTETELPIQCRNSKYVNIAENIFQNSYGCVWLTIQVTPHDSKVNNINFNNNKVYNARNDIRPNMDACIVLQSTTDLQIENINIDNNFFKSYNVPLAKISYGGSLSITNNIFEGGEKLTRVIESTGALGFDKLVVRGNVINLDSPDNFLLNFDGSVTASNNLTIDNNNIKAYHLINLVNLKTMNDLFIANNAIRGINGIDYWSGAVIKKFTCYKNNCDKQLLFKGINVTNLLLTNDANNIICFEDRFTLAQARPQVISEAGYLYESNTLYNNVLCTGAFAAKENLPTTNLAFGQIAITVDKHVYIWYGEWIQLDNVV